MVVLVDGGFAEEANGTKVRESKEDERSESELDDHMEASGEEGEVEVEVVGGEHPFVVDRNEQGEEVPMG